MKYAIWLIMLIVVAFALTCAKAALDTVSEVRDQTTQTGL